MQKVLIVEDNADWRLLLTMIIKRMGYDVVSATTGTEGVRKALSELPNLILMDLGLPEMSGGDATARIKGEEATKNIPIVIQTAFGIGSLAAAAMQAGAAEIMHKPLSILDIQKVLKKYLPTDKAIHSSPSYFSSEVKDSRNSASPSNL